MASYQRNMKDILISFIVPAYNTANFLPSCLNSIINSCSGLYGKEIILVDDGSTDETVNVATNFISLHPQERIVLLRQKNLGLSQARNVGMKESRGRYLFFVDSDDTLSPDASLPEDILIDHDYDIVGFKAKRVLSNGRRTSYGHFYGSGEYRPARLFLKDNNVLPCVCFYFWKKEFLDRLGLEFVPGRFCEDVLFTTTAFLFGGSYFAIDKFLYDYHYRKGSITTTADKQRQEKLVRDALFALEELIKLSKTNEHGSALDLKIDFLSLDILRLLLRHHHTELFTKEITKSLSRIGCYPLHKRKELRYSILRLIVNALIKL